MANLGGCKLSNLLGEGLAVATYRRLMISGTYGILWGSFKEVVRTHIDSIKEVQAWFHTQSKHSLIPFLKYFGVCLVLVQEA